MIWNPEQLEFVVCDFCGGMDTRLIITRRDGLNAVECTHCRLCFINPRPKKELIPSLYEVTYFTKGDGSIVAPEYGFSDYLSEANAVALRQNAEQRLAVASKYLNLRGKVCLEVGCATGEFCYILEKHGAQPVGLDVSAQAIEHAKMRYGGLDFRHGDIMSLEDTDRFDVIFAFEVIEHVTSPKAFFARLATHLKPQGLFILTTPNYICGKRVGVERWFGFLTSFEHLYFFSPEILLEYAKTMNLLVVDCLTGGGNGIGVSQKQIMRRALRESLERVHFLNFARRIRDVMLRTKNGYGKGRYLHNIYLIISKL
jgi:2-polyprenyl-3-methyl-5-hydroxy-6-metoxy-1,4-benzoquinol methylase